VYSSPASQKCEAVVELSGHLFASPAERLAGAPLYLRPSSLQEALEALAATGGTVLSGGTDIFPPLVDRPLMGPVIDISALREIAGIRQTESHVVIGGRTSWAEIVKSSLPRGFDGLKAAAREVGSVQIQNQGTIAGNICNASPAADGVAALMALDAEVTLTSCSGSRTLPLGDFILGNRQTARRVDELLTSVQVPRRLENAASSFLKLGARRYLVISIVMVAANLTVDAQGRIREALLCVGSCSAKAVRLTGFEQALVGIFLSADLAARLRDHHFAPLTPIDDVRGTAAYRNDAARTLVARALAACREKVR
jgi:CO/xanthine dehydrogenase FAD-binding subunit